jgi:hypothetical protein
MASESPSLSFLDGKATGFRSEFWGASLLPKRSVKFLSLRKMYHPEAAERKLWVSGRSVPGCGDRAHWTDWNPNTKKTH